MSHMSKNTGVIMDTPWYGRKNLAREAQKHMMNHLKFCPKMVVDKSWRVRRLSNHWLRSENHCMVKHPIIYDHLMNGCKVYQLHGFSPTTILENGHYDFREWTWQWRVWIKWSTICCWTTMDGNIISIHGMPIVHKYTELHLYEMGLFE